jgi:2-polyprenyl-3-methyl-5-hydroxy-6-metoxy-1,4-benzoquinol methylase
MTRGVRDYISDGRFDVVRCDACGLAVTDPMPGDDVIERYYSARYRGDRHAFTDRLRIALRSRMLESHFAPRFSGRFLDIGCGWGDFAVAMRGRGWDVSVTEINASSLEKLRAAGIDAKTPDEAMHGGGFGHAFDAITCWHVLEHVMRPVELLRWARRILSPGGVFQVTVPSLSSWQAKFGGRHWLHLDVPRHRYHFTRGTLRRILEDNGFDVIDTTTFALEYDWFGWIQTALNGVCSRPNVLFERMTSQARQWPGSRADVALSCVLAPPVAAVTLPLSLLSWACGAGATLTMTCRPRAAPVTTEMTAAAGRDERSGSRRSTG